MSEENIKFGVALVESTFQSVIWHEFEDKSKALACLETVRAIHPKEKFHIIKTVYTTEILDL